MELNMIGKTVVVTGGSTGIGFEAAKEFAREGANVVICGRSGQKLASAAAEFAAEGMEAATFAGDMSRIDEIYALADYAAGRFGGIDVWLNNAGTGISKKMMEFTVDDIDTLIDINFKSVYWGCRAAAERMMGHGGVILNTTSFAVKMPLLNGDIVPATINGIAKGTKGTPGELRGYFSDNEAIGVLLSNGETGVYGSMEQAPVQNQAIPVAMKQEVQEGAAQIFTTIDGTTPKSYDIEIQHVDYNADSPTKNMVIRITDPELLEATGGIVQGMSGSPIIQNGKLVGAVTHVFVEEPERGYGIFAENMLKTSGEIARNGQKDAA